MGPGLHPPPPNRNHLPLPCPIPNPPPDPPLPLFLSFLFQVFPLSTPYTEPSTNIPQPPGGLMFALRCETGQPGQKFGVQPYWQVRRAGKGGLLGIVRGLRCWQGEE